MSSLSSAAVVPLRRFVTDGLRPPSTPTPPAPAAPPLRLGAGLPLATLAELTGLPHYRTLTALRAAQQAIAAVDAELRATGREGLAATEDHTVARAVTTLRTTLARLDPPDPVDPVRPRPAARHSSPCRSRLWADVPGRLSGRGRRALIA